MVPKRATADETPEWAKVFKALGNSHWDFRTVDGIARETQLDPNIVAGLLGKHPSELRKTVSQDGRVIYALKSRPRRTLREFFATLQMFAGR